ncbi:hypothetical protein VNO77_43916 [Canavalia gladiata]|uniref:Uncharacterized protein n=1 Tax=Canavalia gladiata TaxID=3824 RepID=A0AAN9PQ98_CANGL
MLRIVGEHNWARNHLPNKWIWEDDEQLGNDIVLREIRWDAEFVAEKAKLSVWKASPTALSPQALRVEMLTLPLGSDHDDTYIVQVPRANSQHSDQYPEDSSAVMQPYQGNHKLSDFMDNDDDDMICDVFFCTTLPTERHG